MAKEEFINYTEEEFKKAVMQAGELNRKIKEDTKTLGAMKPSIVNYMEQNDIRDLQEGPYKATFITKNSSKMDEEQVIALIEKKVRQARKPERKELIASAIKTVKQVDEDVLEKLVYDGIISAKDLEPMTKTTQSTMIRLDYVNK